MKSPWCGGHGGQAAQNPAPCIPFPASPPARKTTKKSRPTIPQSEHSRRPQRRPPPDARAEEGGHGVEVERGKGGGVLRERLVAYRLVQRLHVVVQVWVQAELEPAWEGSFESELFYYSRVLCATMVVQMQGQG